MADVHEIRDAVALRAVIGNEIPGLAEKNLPELNRFARDFIARSPFLILSTSSSDGKVDASPKGDAPGFVLVRSDEEIVIPDRPGNKLAYGHLNVLENPHVGVLMMIPGTGETLRINGVATLSADPDLLQQLAARDKPATVAIKIKIEEVFFHCAKAFIRSKIWQHESWADPHKVSFGEMYAELRGGDKDAAQQIDEMIETDYQHNL
ncbi:MAG: pyridoxamine 5'-phosphate oxidase family protein [Pseudomonadales bacterium]|nr:pyridoxamine 5'-phosphate oxidase family protein [Pseudomonadales bacterium]